MPHQKDGQERQRGVEAEREPAVRQAQDQPGGRGRVSSHVPVTETTCPMKYRRKLRVCREWNVRRTARPRRVIGSSSASRSRISAARSSVTCSSSGQTLESAWRGTRPCDDACSAAPFGRRVSNRSHVTRPSSGSGVRSRSCLCSSRDGEQAGDRRLLDLLVRRQRPGGLIRSVALDRAERSQEGGGEPRRRPPGGACGRDVSRPDGVGKRRIGDVGRGGSGPHEPHDSTPH